MSCLYFSQNKKIDSLITELKSAIHDTTRLTIIHDIIERNTDDSINKYYNNEFFKLSEKLSTDKNELISIKAKKCLSAAYINIGASSVNVGNLSEALNFYQKALKIGEEIKHKKSISNAYNNIGNIYDIKGDVNTALVYYNKCLKLQEEIGYKMGIASTLNNIGVIYSSQGDAVRALDCYRRSLKIKEDIGYKEGIAKSLVNIAFIYETQGMIKEALNNYYKSLKIFTEIGNKVYMAAALNNIGYIYEKKGNYPLALNYYQKCLAIYEVADNKQGIAREYNHLASVYSKTNDLVKALNFFYKALQKQKEIGDKKSIASSFLDIGQVYFKEKKYLVAQAYSDSAVIIIKELQFINLTKKSESFLSKIDSATGNFKGAFEHYKQFILYRDSLTNEGTRKASIKNQLKYEYEKKEAILKEQQLNERAVAGEKNRIQKIIIASVIAGFLLVVVFAFFIFRTLKITRNQKHIIEEKQKEILDSIHYAKRIQTSLLPSEKYIERKLSEWKA